MGLFKKRKIATNSLTFNLTRSIFELFLLVLIAMLFFPKLITQIYEISQSGVLVDIIICSLIISITISVITGLIAFIKIRFFNKED